MKRRCTARITSMTTFSEREELMRHVFNSIEKGDWQSATLVCKGWRDVSHTIPTRRTANFDVLPMDGPHMEPIGALGGYLGVSKFSLKEIFVKRKHIVQFTLCIGSKSFRSWAELSTSMRHVQWLDLSFNTRDAKNDKGEIEPFIMASLPSLTFLHLSLANKASSLSLHLPALQSLRLSRFYPLDQDYRCPKLETLTIDMERGMVVAPSLISNLCSLVMTFSIVSPRSSISFAMRCALLTIGNTRQSKRCKSKNQI